jgi:hypothetical protein
MTRRQAVNASGADGTLHQGEHMLHAPGRTYAEDH